MLSIETLKAYGANTEEGLKRCMNMEPFYLRIVGMVKDDGNFDRLKQAVAAGDAKEAFEAAHALKGATGNAALTPIFQPVSALTELLRGQSAMPAGGECQRLTDEIMKQLEKLKAL